MSEETKALTQEDVDTGLTALSAEEVLLLKRNADQFRHYINKKAKRLKLAAKLKEVSI
jgi:hypothetical protein